jgi:hypothetical protein
MSDIINALEDTPIPTLLIIAGLFFILLAFVSKLGGWVEVQPTQQKWAIPVGLGLLVLGIVLWQDSVPTGNISQNSQQEFSTGNSGHDSSNSSVAKSSDANISMNGESSSKSAPEITNGNDVNLKLEDVPASTVEPTPVVVAAPSSTVSQSLTSPLAFLENHYSEMQRVVAVDDRTTLERLYQTRFHSSFLTGTNKNDYFNFWINDVSSIDKFVINPIPGSENEFQISLCIQTNNSSRTLTFLFPLIQEGTDWLIGKGRNLGDQSGCRL